MSPAPVLPPDEDLPPGTVIDGVHVLRDLDEGYDYVVVGSGAAGAVAAYTLAEAGFAVALVEEGPWIKTREFVPEVYPTFKRMAREAGTMMAFGRAFTPLIQGRCVGGTTVLNSAIAWRLPEDVIDLWARSFGLGSAITAKDVEPHFDALERDLSVRPVDPAMLGRSSQLLLDHGGKVGVEATVIHRYDGGCRGSGQCLTGCPHGAKQSMNVTYVPWALRRGVELYTSCAAERITLRGGRAVGVVARAGGRAKVRLSARRGVILAASALQTPNLLVRSGLRGPHVGRHFQAHPGLAVAGVFDEPVHMMRGATQGAESVALRASRGFKPETLGMQPELAAVRVPGAGKELVRRLALYPNIAVWALQVRARAEGRVVPAPAFSGARDLVFYTPTPEDIATARGAVALLARGLFEAGAREVWPGIMGVPPVLRSPADVRLIEEASLDASRYTFAATHYFGTARMARDRTRGVVGTDFRHHDAAGLFVVDSSVFPTNLGVNPQHSIMALSRLAATRIAAGRAAFAA